MKFSRSSTAEINWDSPLIELAGNKKAPVALEKIIQAGLTKISDLLWILPLHIHKTPSIRPFDSAQTNQFFKGSGKILHQEIKPAFGRKGRGRILLYNALVVVKDDLSSETMSLRWFNLYPNQKKQILSLTHLTFIGIVEEFKGQRQVVNPKILIKEDHSSYIIEYSTMNKLPGSTFKKIFDLIPLKLWDQIPATLSPLDQNKQLSLGEAFKIIHGKISPEIYTNELKIKAQDRLIYEEFLIDQLKIQTRRKFIKRKSAPVIPIHSSFILDLKTTLPFDLTPDQEHVLNEIMTDLSLGHPMMRMLQGDVGCGKTIIAYLASRLVINQGFQVALMCPTEALAQQHFATFKDLSPHLCLNLLLGSTQAKEKNIF